MAAKGNVMREGGNVYGCRQLNQTLYVHSIDMSVGDAAKRTLRLSQRTIEATKRYARE